MTRTFMHAVALTLAAAMLTAQQSRAEALSAGEAAEMQAEQAAVLAGLDNKTASACADRELAR